LNTRLLISVLLGVVILTNPVSPDGTFTVRWCRRIPAREFRSSCPPCLQ
jgi:hypothetical protein